MSAPFRPGRGPGKGPFGSRRTSQLAVGRKVSYWVGGTGNYSDAPNHWAASSGGAPGASNLPDAFTDVFIDANSGSGTITIDTAAATCFNFTLTWTAAKTNTLSLAVNFTVNGALTIAGQAHPNRALIQSSVLGTQRTLTALVNSLSNIDFQDIAAAGAGPWSGTSIGDCLGNSGITFTPAVTRFWVATTGGSWSATSSWSASSGGGSGASVPLPQDVVVFDSLSISGSGRTITADMRQYGKDVDFSGITTANTLSTSTVTPFLYGNLTWAASLTTSLAQVWNLRSRSATTIAFNGGTLAGQINFSGPGCAWTLQDNASFSTTVGLAFNLTAPAGSFDANGFAVNVTSTGSEGVRITSGTLNMGSGTWTLNSLGNAWNYLAGTVNAQTSTIALTESGATTKTFVGGGKTYNNVIFDGTGTGAFIITGSNTFNQIKCTSPPHTIQVTGGTTQTVSDLSLVGSAGNLITFQSTTTTAFTIAYAGSAGHVTVDYCSIDHSIASPANTFYAAHSTDGGVNTNWTFSGFPYSLAMAAGSYTLTGVAAALLRGYKILAAAGAYVVTGVAAALRWAHVLAGVAGAYALTGKAANLLRGYYVGAAAGSYTMTGKAASLLFGRRLLAAAGAYTLTGKSAALLRAYTLAATSGTYTINGIAVQFPRNYRVTAGPGTYGLTGKAANIHYGTLTVMHTSDGVWIATRSVTRWTVPPSPTCWHIPTSRRRLNGMR